MFGTLMSRRARQTHSELNIIVVVIGRTIYDSSRIAPFIEFQASLNEFQICGFMTRTSVIRTMKS